MQTWTERIANEIWMMPSRRETLLRVGDSVLALGTRTILINQALMVD
jgi:hypothetical protein